MKKQVVFITIFSVLFLSATAANFETMVWGSSATLIGLFFSLMLACAIIIFTILSKPKDLFIKLMLIFTGLLSLTSIIGMLIHADIITFDFVGIIIALTLTPFYGLTYIFPLNLFYYVLIGLSVLGFAVLTSVFFKKEKGNEL